MKQLAIFIAVITSIFRECQSDHLPIQMFDKYGDETTLPYDGGYVIFKTLFHQRLCATFNNGTAIKNINLTFNGKLIDSKPCKGNSTQFRLTINKNIQIGVYKAFADGVPFSFSFEFPHRLCSVDECKKTKSDCDDDQEPKFCIISPEYSNGKICSGSSVFNNTCPHVEGHFEFCGQFFATGLCDAIVHGEYRGLWSEYPFECEDTHRTIYFATTDGKKIAFDEPFAITRQNRLMKIVCPKESRSNKTTAQCVIKREGGEVVGEIIFVDPCENEMQMDFLDQVFLDGSRILKLHCKLKYSYRKSNKSVLVSNRWAIISALVVVLDTEIIASFDRSTKISRCYTNGKLPSEFEVTDWYWTHPNDPNNQIVSGQNVTPLQTEGYQCNAYLVAKTCNPHRVFKHKIVSKPSIPDVPDNGNDKKDTSTSGKDTSEKVTSTSSGKHTSKKDTSTTSGKHTSTGTITTSGKDTSFKVGTYAIIISNYPQTFELNEYLI